MSDLRDMRAEDETTVHLSSWGGQQSWKKVAPTHLPNASELTRREYVEALTIYKAGWVHEQKALKQLDINRLRGLAGSSDQLIRQLYEIDGDPDEGKGLLQLIAGLMRHTATEPEIQKLLAAGKLRASDKNAWEWPDGDKYTRPIDSLMLGLLRLRRAARTITNCAPKGRPKPKLLARQGLLVRLCGVWEQGAEFAGTSGAAGSRLDFLEAVSKTLPDGMKLGKRKTIAGDVRKLLRLK
jgi:hypothetical protein